MSQIVIEPVDVTKLSDDELDKLIEQRRERRMALHAEYEKAQAAKRFVFEERLQSKVDRALKGFEKKLASVDKGIEELEKRALILRSLRLELGDDIGQ